MATATLLGDAKVRVTVWVPDELHATMKAELPGLNVSQLMQEAIRQRLNCVHTQLACAQCALPMDRSTLIDAEFSRFYAELLHRLEPLVRRVGTAEGAARVIKEVAGAFRITVAERLPLPRPSEANRELARDRAFEDAARAMQQPRQPARAMAEPRRRPRPRRRSR